MDKQLIKQKIQQGLKRFLYVLGSIFFFLLFLSFTDLPYYAYYWLGTSSPKLNQKPAVIVLLGGAGMPSPDGFMRCYYTSEAAAEFPDAKIVIALPSNADGTKTQLELMRKELMLHKVDSTRISFESEGFNTRSQAEHLATVFAPVKAITPVLIVTSPEHMYRAIKTFKTVGFKEVGGEATFEEPVNEKKAKDNQQTEDVRVRSVSLRYNMWSYLNYELLVLREYTAITYYWIKGWI